MTRQEGIIKAYQEKHGFPPENPVALMEFEYLNYCESCDHCGEQPIPFDTWIKETINPS